MLNKVPFLFASVRKGLQRSFTYPKLQFLTRLRIATNFVYKAVGKYNNQTTISRVLAGKPLQIPKYGHRNSTFFL